MLIPRDFTDTSPKFKILKKYTAIDTGTSEKLTLDIVLVECRELVSVCQQNG